MSMCICVQFNRISRSNVFPVDCCFWPSQFPKVSHKVLTLIGLKILWLLAQYEARLLGTDNWRTRGLACNKVYVRCLPVCLQHILISHNLSGALLKVFSMWWHLLVWDSLCWHDGLKLGIQHCFWRSGSEMKCSMSELLCNVRPLSASQPPTQGLILSAILQPWCLDHKEHQHFTGICANNRHVMSGWKLACNWMV